LPPGACLAAALSYARRGWPVLPCAGKSPVVGAWQVAATTDPAVIRSWWPPGSRHNLGVQLGPRSGLLDVECDSASAEQALGVLLGEAVPVVPTYQARRGRHRLFCWSPDLPCPDKASFHYHEIEFRTGNGGKGAQSLFPPSVHPDGPVYAWLVHPDDVDPAPFPAAALGVVRRGLGTPQAGGKAPGRRARVLAEGEKVRESGRNTFLASIAGTLRRRGADEEEIFSCLLVFNASRCEPPLGDDEVRDVARKITRYTPADVPGAVIRPAPPRHAPRTLEFTVAVTAEEVPADGS
jgi:hypothetical protein